MQNLLGVLEEFCHSSGLAVNVEKTKMMVVQTIQPHHYPMLTYRGEHIQFVQTLNILVLMYPPQINGVRALILGCKPVGYRITFWRTNATKVILVDGK